MSEKENQTKMLDNELKAIGLSASVATKIKNIVKNPKYYAILGLSKPSPTLEKGKIKGVKDAPEEFKREQNKNMGGKLKNPEKADLNKDGKLSGYEQKRGKVIEKAMKLQKRYGGTVRTPSNFGM